jgi:chromosome segregation ATPase
MQDYYQFDTAQKNQAIAMEDSMRKQHETAVSVAENKAAEGVALQKDNAINEDREKTAQRILALEGQIKVLENDIGNLRSDLSRASAAAASARAMGRIHLDKSGQISREINSKQTRIQNLRAEINRTQR